MGEKQQQQQQLVQLTRIVDVKAFNYEEKHGPRGLKTSAQQLGNVMEYGDRVVVPRSSTCTCPPAGAGPNTEKVRRGQGTATDC